MTLTQSDFGLINIWIFIKKNKNFKIQNNLNKQFLTIVKDDIGSFEIELEEENQSLTQEWVIDEFITNLNLYIIKSSIDRSICLAVDKRNNIVLTEFKFNRDFNIEQKTWFIENLDRTRRNRNT